MFRIFAVTGVVLTLSLVGVTTSFGAPKEQSPVDANIINTVDVRVVSNYFVFSGDLVLSGADSDETVTFAVPTDKELIIEWISLSNATSDSPPGQTVGMTVSYPDGPGFPSANLFTSTAYGGSLGGNSAILLPVPPDTDVSVSVRRITTGKLETYRVTVTGRLIDVAQ